MSMRPVLILGLAPRVTLTIARSLHRRKIPVLVGELARIRELGAGRPLFSRAVQRSVLLPDGRSLPDEFRASIAALIRDEGIDMLIPCGDAELAAVAPLRGEFEGRLHVGCPPAGVVRNVLDKDRTLEFAQRCGIPIPATHCVQGSADLARLREALRFPVIAKPQSASDADSHSLKVRYFADFESLAKAFEGGALPEIPILLQEYCAGAGVGVGMLVHGGEAIASFQHRRLKELPSTGGMSVLAMSERVDAQLGEWSLALLRSLAWEGVAMVEFRCDPATGAKALMEVNGRYWGALAAGVNAGVDFPYYEWQLAHGQSPRVPGSYPIGLRTRWMVGDLLRLRRLVIESDGDGQPRPSAAREALRFLMDFRLSTRGAIASAVDPLPALLELGGAIRRNAIGDAKRLVKRLVKGVLPEHLRWHTDIRHGLEPPARRVSLVLQLARSLRIRRDRPRRLFRGVRNVLFVCEGNILRSPVAAAFLEHRLDSIGRGDVRVESVGLGAIPGRQADPRGVEVAREFGASLEAHRATRISAEVVERADAIFVMDRLNEAKLLARFPRAARKLSLLGNWLEAPETGPAEIADPVHGGIEDVRHCYALIDSAMSRLVTAFVAAEATPERSTLR